MMASGVTDVPVTKLANDAFSISTYVKGLSSFIRHCNTPMTISIQGDWGSGKTSMMNMLKEDLETSIIPIWFNTWQFSQFNLNNSLIFAMLDVLMNSLDDGSSSTVKKAKSICSGIAKCVVGAGISFFTGNQVNGQEAVNSITDKGIEANYALQILELKKSFQDLINEKLKKSVADRVVIFVDDLDRLQPGKTIELLEVLKLFLDCENCVFVLAVDYEIVTLGVKEKYGDSVTEEKGRSFFDKIIQLPFKMPVSNYDIKEYVQKTLTGMGLGVNDALAEHFVRLIGASIGYNPRAMKRLFNTYQLLDTITKDVITELDGGVRERELFGIICMQMSFEELYRYIAAQINYLDAETLEVFVGENAADRIKEDDEFVMSISKAGYDVNERIRQIIKFMECFYNVVDLDGNKKLDSKELGVLQKIFKFSRITSVGNDTNNDTNPRDWDRRERTKGFVNAVNAKINSIEPIESLRLVATRGTERFNDAKGEAILKYNSYEYCLRYYVEAKEGDFVNVSLYLVNWVDKKHSETMKAFFGKDPLGVGGFVDNDDYGSYTYDLGIFNLRKPDSVDKLANAYVTAYRNIMRIFENGGCVE
ncbi:MAG: P-loop NTPase fold protein [Phascolarctobacterium sp.]